MSFSPERMQVIRLHQDDLERPVGIQELLTTLLHSFTDAAIYVARAEKADLAERKLLMTRTKDRVAELVKGMPHQGRALPDEFRKSKDALVEIDRIVKTTGLLALRDAVQGQDLRGGVFSLRLADADGQDVLSGVIDTYDSMTGAIFNEMYVDKYESLREATPMRILVEKHRMEFDPSVKGSVGWALYEGIELDDRFQYMENDHVDLDKIRSIVEEAMKTVGEDADEEAVIAAASPKLEEYLNTTVAVDEGVEVSLEKSTSPAKGMLEEMLKKHRSGSPVHPASKTVH